MSLVSKVLSLASRLVALVAIVVLVGPLVWKLSTGDQFLEVKGESMRPTYEVGDVLVVKKPTGHDLVVGQPVVASFGEVTDERQYYTHRVYEVREDRSALLKGDNNEVPDVRAITQDSVVGTPRTHLSGGTASLYLLTQDIVGRLVLVAVVALFGVGIPSMLTRLDIGTDDVDPSAADARDRARDEAAPSSTEPCAS